MALPALTLMACACSTAPPPRPMASVSPNLLAPPPSLPQPRRDSSGQMTGREALASLTLASLTALYDIAGQIRATLVELQAELRLTQEPAHAQSR